MITVYAKQTRNQYIGICYVCRKTLEISMVLNCHIDPPETLIVKCGICESKIDYKLKKSIYKYK